VSDCLQWRYTRDKQVLYVTAEYAPSTADYELVCHRLDGTREAMHFSALRRLYDYLGVLERQLGAEGWELLPLEQRAPNRLRTPMCAICPIDRHVDVTARTPTHLHFRCSGCGYTWVVPKPGPPVSAQDPDEYDMRVFQPGL
jgi:hypothetical protein